MKRACRVLGCAWLQRSLGRMESMWAPAVASESSQRWRHLGALCCSRPRSQMYGSLRNPRSTRLACCHPHNSSFTVQDCYSPASKNTIEHSSSIP